ncbi:6307_t:CDS:2 [Dentiscutata heterogama]|uniref:6307_t:CDS:1 n=1 Tax=Dentiscutata heterogama TaxID=1316150 RepID=A0ACA9MEJ9_9GLOM|nr:6307_t:CDS:2 [Dentiscutata heterogama]
MTNNKTDDNIERKQHIITLQDVNRINYTRDELISLIDAGELRGDFKEYIDWRNEASNNIAILKSAFKNGKTQSHDHIYAKLCEVKVDDSLQNDPLCVGVIDFSSDRYQLSGNNYKDLVGEKADIRELTKSAGIKKLCADFVVGRNELKYEKERIVRGIIDVLLQEIKLNALRKVSHGSENSLVEIIVRLIDTAMYRLPVGYEIEVTRAERQSIASKNWKVQQQKGSRGNKPDLMIRMLFHRKWYILRVENGTVIMKKFVTIITN